MDYLGSDSLTLVKKKKKGYETESEGANKGCK